MKVDFGGGVVLDAEAQLREIIRVDYEDSLYLFLRDAWKYIDAAPWKDTWAIEAIAEHLQAVIDGDIKRLLINIPPRFGKSSICSVCLPAWTWAQPERTPTSGPGTQFLHASYANQLSLRDSVKCRRLIESPWYQSMWGSRFKLNGDQNTKHRFGNDQGGERLITSVGAAVTGEGGNCFAAGTQVSTPDGPRAIERLSAGDAVLAFDHSRGTVVNSRVVAAAERKSSDTYSLHSLSGRGFICTGDHPVYSPGRGYVRASEMGRGDRMLVEGRARRDASPSVRQLREAGGQTSFRSPQGPDAKKQGRLLLQEVLLGASRRKKPHHQMRSVRKSGQKSAHKILLRGMQIVGSIQQAADRYLSSLQNCLWRQPTDEILFAGMCERRPFNPDARERKLEFHQAGKIFKSVRENAPPNFRARRASVRGVRTNEHKSPVEIGDQIHSSCASHRSKFTEQRSNEPDHFMPSMPRETPRWLPDYVDRIERNSPEPVSVYDIQVEGQSNFFADGILVHNCIIIDDPNAANESFSEATIQSTIDWWDATMSTRLNDAKTGAYIVIQQRLAENDLSGHILENESDDWTHLCLPMRYEPDRMFTTSIGWSDPRTKPGELLAPDRFDDIETKRLERRLGPYGTSGQLQQRPEPAGGGIIKREWWQLWEPESYPPMDFILASLDTAYTEKEMNDPSAMTIWGVFTEQPVAQPVRVMGLDGRPAYDERAYQEGAPNVMLMYAWTERLELHALVTKVASICKRMKVDMLVIENKASGISVSQELRRLYAREKFSVILADPKSMDKMSRLYSVQHLFSEGMVFAPDKKWAEMVFTQVGQFPRGKHDDLVDTTSQSLRKMRDMGLLIRAEERQGEIEDMRVYPGGQELPLYPV